MLHDSLLHSNLETYCLRLPCLYKAGFSHNDPTLLQVSRPRPLQDVSVATAAVTISTRSNVCLPLVRAWLTRYVAEFFIPCQHLLSSVCLVSFPDASMGPRQHLHAALNSGHLVEGLTNPPPLVVVVVLIDFNCSYSLIWSSNCHKVAPFSQLASLTGVPFR